MGLLNFFGKLLGLGRRFNGTPEQFLGMAQCIAAKNNPNYTRQELLQWGETVKREVKTLRNFDHYIIDYFFDGITVSNLT